LKVLEKIEHIVLDTNVKRPDLKRMGQNIALPVKKLGDLMKTKKNNNHLDVTEEDIHHALEKEEPKTITII